MDTLVSETVAALHTLPDEAKRLIAVGLLASGTMPVIEFTDPALDQDNTASDTAQA